MCAFFLRLDAKYQSNNASALAALVTRDAMIGVAKAKTAEGRPYMNAVHDMGGMHDMRPIQYEETEPVFHEQWESRAFALMRAMRAWQKWPGSLPSPARADHASRISAHELLRAMDRSAGRTPGQDQSCYAR